MKPKPGDIRYKVLENMILVATKHKSNVEKALSAFMDISSNEVLIILDEVGVRGQIVLSVFGEKFCCFLVFSLSC